MDTPQTPETEKTTEEEKPVYIERPKWQLVLAWTLIGIVVVGVLLQFYWMTNT